jgi:hypothetical protein
MSLLLSLFACAAPHDVHPAMADPHACLAGWTRTAKDSLSSEQRSAAAAPWDTPPAYVLAVPVGAPLVPARHTAEWLMGRPVFWFDEAYANLYVDEDAFETITPVDVTALEPGRSVFVGQVLPQTRVALGDRDLVELLLQSDVLRIYGEDRGRVCLIEETKEGGVWMGRIVGEHDGRGRLDFQVRVDGGGHITATGV